MSEFTDQQWAKGKEARAAFGKLVRALHDLRIDKCNTELEAIAKVLDQFDPRHRFNGGKQ